MKPFSYHAVRAIAIALGVTVTLRAQAEDPLERVRNLYSSAAYEAALSAAANIDDSAAALEVAHYRILCLVALGRTADAEQAIEGVLSKQPLYRPEAVDTPPRIQELFASVRRRVGPSIAKTMYVDGKDAFERKDRAVAVHTFEALVRVTDDADLRDDPSVAEIRVLAGGFLTLSKALPAAEEPHAVAAAPVEPVSPRAPVAAAPRVQPPVPIREDLPMWAPAERAARRFAFDGAVRVSIGVDGTVSSVELLKSIHPSYDGILLRAAEKWKYQPGRVNGTPVPSERIVKIHFKEQTS